MATLFLFTQQFDNGDIPCLLMDNNGNLVEPLSKRTSSEIKELQQPGVKTIAVIPTDRTGLLTVKLPKLDERKARTAIPFSLEEQLAQPVSIVHFSFNNKFYQDKHYLVVVIEKSFLQDLIDELNKRNITIDEITTDWFATSANSGCITTTNLLVHTPDFKGAMAGEIATNYLIANTSTPVSTFNDSTTTLDPKSKLSIEEPYQQWVAKKLLQSPRINLCQGEFKQGTKEKYTKLWLRLSTTLAVIWLVSLLGLNIFNLLIVKHKSTKVDLEIARIYHDFFPNSKRIISPRFRINQLLNTGQSSREEAFFWTLLSKLNKAYNANSVTINDLRVENNMLSMTVAAKSFDKLEKLREQLQNDEVKVTQSQATTQNEHVVATMELTL